MAILSTNQRLINVGDSYSAGNGIDITNNIISVTGDNAPYSAGDNIDIQDHIISGKDWSNDIENASANAYNVTTAWVQDNYANSADMTYISAMVDTKLDTSAWSSVSGDLATESYVIMADNITYDRAKGYVDSKGYATEEFVNENTSGKLDSSSFAEASGNFYTNDNPSGYITGVDLTPYVPASSIGTKLYDGVNIVSSISGFKISAFEAAYSTFASNANESLTAETAYVAYRDSKNNRITAYYQPKLDFSGLDGTITAINNSAVAGDVEVNQIVHTNSSTWNDVTAYQSNSSNYITAHQDISNLMPKSESANFYPMTGNPSGFINTLPEEEEVEFEEINLSSFATSSQINDLSAAIDYVSANAGGTGEYVPLDTNGSNVNINLRNKEWQFSGSYSQGKISLGDGSNGAYIGYSNTGGHPEYNWTIGGSMGGIGGYHYRLSMLGVSGNDWKFGSAEYNRLVPTSTTADENKILSVNNQGNPEWVTAGGAGNPEVENYVQSNSANIDDTVTSFQTNSSTYMVEPNLEFNAVGEISGYGNSAIAQYGAEKQWLVHDDTLVHAANSAQYALGVNVSALQRLMGIDETVLYSSTTSAGVLTANLSEPLSSFNTIEVYSNRKNAGELNLIGYTKFKTDYTPSFISITGNTIAGTTQTFLIYEMFGVSQTALSYISGTNILVNGTNMSVLESPGFSNAGITKVIGIGRKQS